MKTLRLGFNAHLGSASLFVAVKGAQVTALFSTLDATFLPVTNWPEEVRRFLNLPLGTQVTAADLSDQPEEIPSWFVPALMQPPAPPADSEL